MDNLSFIFKISQKTAKKRLDEIRNILLDLSIDKINNNDRLNQQPLIIDNKIKIYTVVDTTLFPIRRPNYFEEIFYSTKHKKHGIKFEVGCRISDGKIIWVSEGNFIQKDYYGGTEHDLEISRKSGLISNEIYKFEENEKILADKGYVEEKFEGIILPYRQMIENVFSRIKACKILVDSFRGDIDILSEYIKIIFYIFNIWIQNNPMRIL
ncbi:hypothetical protein ACTFIU_011279 [Dictyostelium citrinum]